MRPRGRPCKTRLTDRDDRSSAAKPRFAIYRKSNHIRLTWVYRKLGRGGIDGWRAKAGRGRERGEDELELVRLWVSMGVHVGGLVDRPRPSMGRSDVALIQVHSRILVECELSRAHGSEQTPRGPLAISSRARSSHAHRSCTRPRPSHLHIHTELTCLQPSIMAVFFLLSSRTERAGDG